jgi:hypothetical protein
MAEARTPMKPTPVVGLTRIVPVTLSVDTGALIADDVIADTQVVSDALACQDGTGILQSVTVFDLDDETAFDFDIFIHRTSTSLGTENGVISISDADAVAAELKCVSFEAADAIDLVNSKMYQKANLGLPVRAVLGTPDLYISMVCRSGTPDFTAATDVVVVLGFLCD